MSDDPELTEWAEAMKEWALGAPLDEALAYSRDLVNRVVAEHAAERTITGIVGMLSGGNDSTAFCHAFRDRLTHVAHVNTGIGIPDTRRHVRDVTASWGLPLVEVTPPPGSTYEELVLRYGFPGPSAHGNMYRNLKERGFRSVRRQLVTNHRKERVVFMAGMRHFESARRMRNTEETHRDGSTVWISPFAWWTDAHLNEYRERYEVPHNEVSDHLHMSGECLCGSYAKPGELEQVRFFYPETAAYIDGLAAKAKAAKQHCQWGVRPPRKPKGASGPTWLCFCRDSPHGSGSLRLEPSALEALADACPDGTWWNAAAKNAPVLEAGPMCVKCEVGVEGLE